METTEDKLILNMPFDESDGATTAYDYSKTRADGEVIDAHFVPGNNGNAISFDGNGARCEVAKNVFVNLAMDFTISLWAQSSEVVCGTPKQIIWVLNFGELNCFETVAIDVQPRAWYNLALVRSGNEFKFYKNTALIATIANSNALVGISLNQDYYGSEYGLGLLDDVKVYNAALSQAELVDDLANSKQQSYTIDGVDFKTFGVYVSGSKGVVNRPKLKTMASVSWDNYHGDAVDLQHKFYQAREITLSCFVKAKSKLDFMTQVAHFEQEFDKLGTQRLMIDVHPIKPLIYEVYCKDEINITKQWNDKLMVGTFDLKLIEPEPVKRILKHWRTDNASKTVTITMTTQKLVNIYWGDGTASFDVYGDNKTITHDYNSNGEFYPVITGCIDEITDFTTNAIIIWNKL